LLLRDALDKALPGLYRLAEYFMLSLVDDPAILAMAFC